MIPIYKPYLPPNSLRYAHEAIDSGWISSQGKYVSQAEDMVKEKNQSKFALLTNSGTSATHLLSIGLKHKYPDIDTLIVPNGVYVAAWNSFMMSEDYIFRVAEMNPDTWNSNYIDAIHAEHNLKDIMPHLDHARMIGVLVVHNLGNIVNVPKIQNSIRDWSNRTIFVEDNCEGFLGSYNNTLSGNASLLSSVSFFGNKTITSGEGGAVFTNDEELFEHLNSVKNQGNCSSNYIFNKLGYNYRMTNVQAAILLGQLEILDEILEKKRTIFNTYKQELCMVDEIDFQEAEVDTSHSNWMFSIKCKLKSAADLQLNLYRNKIDSRSMFPPINQHKHLSQYPNDCVADELWKSVLMLPSYPELTKSEVVYICKHIKDYFKQ
jgi:perosamine synthetase